MAKNNYEEMSFPRLLDLVILYSGQQAVLHTKAQSTDARLAQRAKTEADKLGVKIAAIKEVMLSRYDSALESIG